MRIAWYEGAGKNLEIVLGVQSPYDAAEALAEMFDKVRAPFKPAKIKAHFAYMGGGFGGRDHTTFPFYVSLAAIFLPGASGPAGPRPLSAVPGRHQAARLQDAHAHRRRPCDRQDHRVCGDHVLDGGGLANFSVNVASVSAMAAIGIYDVPKVDITTVALHSRGVTAGSMRGYGTLQTMTALETLIDETAAALPLDPDRVPAA